MAQTVTTTISAKGQITVPIQVREKLGLAPGSKIGVELGPDGSFVARKAGGPSFFAKFQGIGKAGQVPYRDSREAMEVLRGPMEQGDLD